MHLVLKPVLGIYQKTISLSKHNIHKKRSNINLCIGSVCAKVIPVIFYFSVAPNNVRLIGPSEARAGDSLNFECITENSNPPATIQWFVDNRTVSTETQTTNTVTSPSGGWVTRSNISVAVNPNDRNKIISCNAINSELNDIKTQSHVLTIICKYTYLFTDKLNGDITL